MQSSVEHGTVTLHVETDLDVLMAVSTCRSLKLRLILVKSADSPPMEHSEGQSVTPEHGIKVSIKAVMVYAKLDLPPNPVAPMPEKFCNVSAQPSDWIIPEHT